METSFSEIPLFHRGKVRDIYDLGGHLLIVATDRISAFDVVLPIARERPLAKQPRQADHAVLAAALKAVTDAIRPEHRDAARRKLAG